jgi:predicted nuclease with TOPRIM domain
MSEITRGVIGMPYEMAMVSEMSRRQFHGRAQELLAESEKLKGLTALAEEARDGYRADKIRLAHEVDRLRGENEALRLRCDRLDADKAAMAETHVLYTWLRKKCDQPSNDLVVVQMNIGHDWATVHDLDRNLRP